MLSNSSKYAINAVLYLALNSNKNKKVMVKDIAASINVPQAYIAKLLQELSRQQIISSTRGPRGGFYLNDEDRNQSLMSIVHVIDGERRMKSCLLSLKNCDDNRPCPLHEIMTPSRAKLISNLENKTIDELSLDIAEGKSFLPL